jgi:hypothetical protein
MSAIRASKLTILGGAFLLLLLGILLATAARAQAPQQTYDLSWWTVDGGGETFSTGGGYELGGTIGQADAGTLFGGGYTLGGGFWGSEGPPVQIYLPLVMKSF